MTVTTEDTDKKYAGNGSTFEFSTVFSFDSNSEVKVSLSNDTSGVSVDWTLGTEYTLTGAGTGNAGQVTVETSPTDYTPLSGETLVVELDPAFTQPTPLPRGGTVSPKAVLEPMHDSRVRQILTLKKDTDRSIKAPVADASPGLDLPIAALRASKFLGFNNLGDVIVQTLAEIGAVIISSANPLVAGAADPGTSGEVSDGEHVHPSAKDVAEILTNKIMNDFSNLIHANAIHLKSRNVSGVPFNRGQPVYEDDYNPGQDTIEILLADANDASKMPALGIVDEGILNNANGDIIKVGVITGDATDNLDTTGGGEAWVVGDDLYVSTTAGELTNVRPTGAAEQVQAIATVLRVHATLGVIMVDGAGRANEAPNLISANAQIQWKKGADIASAAALPLLTDGNYFDVTGTTGITSINTTGKVGTTVKFHFDGILILTDDADNLVLNVGGGNITTAAGDEIEFTEYAAGKFIRTGGAKADGTAFVGSAGGILVQEIVATDATVATTTTQMPVDNTIPQNTEGAEFLAVTITPTNASNRLVITGVFNFNADATNVDFGVALFQDSTAGAICSTANHGGASATNNLVGVPFMFEMVAGTTSATTFKMRAGPGAAVTLTFNGEGGVARFGGTQISSLRVKELTV